MNIRMTAALRNLERKRREYRLAKALFLASLIGFAGTIFGWYSAISWGFEGMGEPGVEKGGTVFLLLLGLTVLLGATGFAVGYTGLMTYESADKAIEAKYDYEDACTAAAR